MIHLIQVDIYQFLMASIPHRLEEVHGQKKINKCFRAISTSLEVKNNCRGANDSVNNMREQLKYQKIKAKTGKFVHNKSWLCAVLAKCLLFIGRLTNKELVENKKAIHMPQEMGEM